MTAQWDDDIHHAIHAAVSGERQGYYARFRLAGDAGADAASTATSTRARTRRSGTAGTAGRWTPRPSRPPGCWPTRCTHDQVGNRADRRPAVAEPDVGPAGGQGGAGARIALHRNAFHGRGVGVVEPVPVLQLAIPSPSWPGPPPRAARREFAEHGWDADEIPDPQDPETFLRSKLNWDEVDDGEHAPAAAAVPRH